MRKQGMPLIFFPPKNYILCCFPNLEFQEDIIFELFILFA